MHGCTGAGCRVRFTRLELVLALVRSHTFSSPARRFLSAAVLRRDFGFALIPVDFATRPPEVLAASRLSRSRSMRFTTLVRGCPAGSPSSTV